MEVFSDEYFMKHALREAQEAFDAGEVPVGAVVVSQNQIIAKGHNSVELLRDVTAHAEIIAITAAMQYLDSKYLPECTLYVTLEPCPMCAGALKWSQIERVVYGAGDDKGGFMKFGKEMLHPRTKLEFGISHDACSTLLKQFFAEVREVAKS
ncbi:MAG: nucleoside deaminase [Bacteroidetes bacterium]|nr:MAG: nucleoside deaminase [Bacteroidota bacterium]